MAAKKKELEFVTRSLSASEIRDKRIMVGNAIEDAKARATLTVLRRFCNEVDIELKTRFGALPAMIPCNCPTGHGTQCDTCNYLVQYSLKDKKAYCLTKDLVTKTERRD